MDKSVSLGQLDVVRYRSIHEVDESLWDSVHCGQELLHSHRFIRSVEDAGVEDSDFWYLLFYRRGKLVATAALSAFTVSLDLFVGGTSARFIGAVRRWFPRFLKLKILVCGLPVSLGQANLVICDPAQSEEVLARLAQEMSEICRTHGVRYACVKEFLEGQIGIMDRLTDHGFFRANSIPYVSMDIRWPTFEAYLSDMRHKYRRPIKLALRRLGQSRPEIVAFESVARFSETPTLVTGGSEACSPNDFYELYLQVMDRAQVKLETLNRSFFEHLYVNMADDVTLLAMIVGEDLLGAALLMACAETMTFLLVGLDYSRRDEYQVYFNLVYGIIALAIERGCTRLDLGQTSYWLKQRIGGTCIPEYLYFKANRWYVHICLKALGSVIFPPVTLKKPRVFRN